MVDQNAADFFSFQAMMNQLGKGGRTFDKSLYRMFPQTATKAAGMGTGYTGMVTPNMLSKGAMGVAKMGARRLPLIAGGLQAVTGDPIGGAGTAAGGVIGGVIGGMTPLGPLGALAGSYIGSQLGQGATRGLAGIDINDPLTGPDISLLGIPLTQYAKTKKSYKRATELAKDRYKELQPLMEEAKDRQFGRDVTSSQMQLAGNLLGQIYGRM